MITKRKLMILLVILGISLGLITRDAVASPPWTAVVRQIDDYCYTEWLADDLTTITKAWMDLHEVYQPHNGIKNGSCHGWIDYSSPYYASIADICANTDWSIFCNGQGNMLWGNNDETVPIACIDEFGNFTFNTEGKATRSGQVSVTCHYKISSP